MYNVYKTIYVMYVYNTHIMILARCYNVIFPTVLLIDRAIIPIEQSIGK